MTPVSESTLENLHATATRLFTGALEACSIESAFDRRIRVEGNLLYRLMPDGAGPETIDLSAYKRIFVIAIGKAAAPMLDVLLSRIKRRKGMRGICCTNHLPKKRNWRFRYFESGHPVPNEESLAGARAALALLKKAKRDTLVFFLISGGGSALFDLPLDASLTLEDVQNFHRVLLGSGAPIGEINILRKHFSAVKGGRLAMAAAEATKVSFLLPDVPLRSLDMLSSGPTAPDHSTVAEVRAIMERYELGAKFPPAVRAFFEREDMPESPGNKSWRPPFLPRIAEAVLARRIAAAATMKDEDDAFRDSVFEILLSSHDLVENTRTLAQREGFYVAVDNSCDDWDYADAARYLLQTFNSLRTVHPRLCLISAGEVTVTLSGTPGAGGRNQQFALACALELARYEGEPLTVLSGGTDGVDGNTRSAGAIADPTTVTRAKAFGFDPDQALADFNACPLFTALGDSLVTGPTGHNLRDLRLLISGG